MRRRLAILFGITIFCVYGFRVSAFTYTPSTVIRPAAAERIVLGSDYPILFSRSLATSTELVLYHTVRGPDSSTLSTGELAASLFEALLGGLGLAPAPSPYERVGVMVGSFEHGSTFVWQGSSYQTAWGTQLAVSPGEYAIAVVSDGVELGKSSPFFVTPKAHLDISLGSDDAVPLILSGESSTILSSFNLAAHNDGMRVNGLSASFFEGSPIVPTELSFGTDNGALSSLTVHSPRVTSFFDRPLLISSERSHPLFIRTTFASSSRSLPPQLFSVSIDSLFASTTSGAEFAVEGTPFIRTVRVVSAYPRFVQDSVPRSQQLSSGAVMRFRVTAVGGPIALAKLTFRFAGKDAQVRGVRLFAFEDENYTVPVAQLKDRAVPSVTRDPVSLAADHSAVFSAEDDNGFFKPLLVHGYDTVFFELRVDATLRTEGSFITATLSDDNDIHPRQSAWKLGDLIRSPLRAFVWSPFSGVTPNVEKEEWIDGTGVSGLGIMGTLVR